MATSVGDLVLIHHKGQPVVFARLEEVSPDAKAGWWQARLLFLQVPPQEVTWILREEYINGQEFTMGGDAIRLERLDPPAPLAEDPPPPADPEGQDGSKPGGKVLSLASRKGKGA